MNDRTAMTAAQAQGALRAEAPPQPDYAGRPRDTQLEYKAILANASIGIAFTRERKFFLCNPKFAEMFGWGADELIGQPGEVVYPSRESYDALGAIAIPTLGAGQQLDIEWEMRRKDGSTFLAHMVAKAINAADAAQGTVWIVEDITEKKRQADEIGRLFREQEAILDTASIGICFLRERHVVRCNRRMEEMYGYAPGELNGKPTAITYVDEADHARAQESYARMSQGQSYTQSVAKRRKDGSVFWERSTGRAVDPVDPQKGSVWLLEDITEQKRAEEELGRVLAEQQALVNNIVVGICFVRDRKVVRCNRRFEELFGYSAGEALQASTRQFYFTDEDYERSRTYGELDAGRIHTREQWLRRKDGSGFWCRLTGRAVEAGSPGKGYVWLFEDVTERKRADEEVRRLADEQRLTLDNATVGISFVRERMFQRCNPRLEEMFGYAPGELLGQSTALFYPSAEEFEAARDPIYKQIGSGQTYTGEHQYRRKDGTLFWCKVVGKAINPARADRGSIWIYDDVGAERAAREQLEAARDALERAVAERTAELQAANQKLEAEINERKQAETRAQHLADHDVLTGLPNRRLLEDRLTQALALSYRNRKQTAVMFVDLDRFKNINDSLGHASGDVLLKEVADRLVRQLRVGDTICRIGGDEFVIVLPEIKRSSDAAHVAQKIIETVSQPVPVEERDLQVTASIGISVFPEDGRDAETLIRNADAAMYHAKETGRANYQFFTDQMNLAATRRLTLENDLRRAVQKGEMRVYYQPVNELQTGCAVAHEALVRWQHPTRGVIAPSEFIQLAEDTGLILKIGEWVLREACRWANFIGTDRGLLVSVNLSPRQFLDPRLVELVAGVLRDSGLPPRLLELEITESTAMQHTDVTLATLVKLKELGVSIAIDDFGTGYSSLAYLKRFPVDKLKIDKSFVAELALGSDQKAIVAAIIGLAHTLGLKVCAEGVETESQLEFLQSCRCDYIQGYITGRPVDADTAAREYV
jgi:diguanylate cyclase (GGDEF)-like protein/PAS domain S-box-containing protein